ncbi:MAG: hypothetical protein JSV04_10730 [Candidatus Heimdallarchaeota archaeon]|nr:MAG: hypothetical protein JSV04_10730 [Candidatus Heimdallarchaeota archaeon]
MNLRQKILKETDITEEEMAQLTDRALILLSLKDNAPQNLKYMLDLLEIRTVKETQNVLQTIFRLIREGIVYIPEGLPELVDKRTSYDIENLHELDDIDLCLLLSFDQLIKEIQNEINKLRTKSGTEK